MNGYYNSLMMICHTPIEDGQVRAWHGLMVEPPNFPMNDDDKAAVPAFQEGPFGKARLWYKQFYNPRKDAKKHQAKSNGHWITKGTKRDPWVDAAE